MPEIEESVVGSTQTVTVIDTTKVEAYCCFAKGLYTNRWQSISVWPHLSCETTFEAFKERTRQQILMNKTPHSDVITVKFVKVELS